MTWIATTPPRTSSPEQIQEVLATRFERRQFGEFPTRVEHCADLGRAIGCEQLWAKRDDLALQGAAGSKLRAIQWLWPDLEQQPGGAIAFGPAGSNWARALLLVAREHALPVDVHTFRHPGNTSGMPALAAVLPDARSFHDHHGPVRMGLGIAWQLVRGPSPRPRLLPTGGTTPLTVLAQVDAAFEVAAQVREGALPAPDLCYVAHGTGGTPAGLALGFKLAGLPTEVVGVRVATRLVSNMPMTRRWIRAGSRLLRRAGLAVPPARACALRMDGRFFAPGYGRPTPAGDRTSCGTSRPG